MESHRERSTPASKHRIIWLVGTAPDKISGCKLPSNRQVFGRFHHLHIYETKTIRDSALITTDELLEFWTNIPTQKKCYIVERVKDIFLTWKSIRKNASRRVASQVKKESDFVDILDDLFDVARKDALSLIEVEEDRQFLIAQREKGRRGSMLIINEKASKEELRRSEREKLKTERENKEVLRCEEANKTTTFSEDDTSAAESNDDHMPMSPPKKAKASKLITPELASALDRSKISDRNATYVLAAALKSVAKDPNDYVLNKESIRQSRRKHREATAKEIKKDFKPDTPLTVHWDGKLLQDLTSKAKVERTAVIVSGDGVMKLLGVPKIPSSTGESQATAIFETLEEWGLSSRVSALSFDTTSSNTGRLSGACLLLQQKLGRQLLNLACRHHVHELVIARVYDALMEVSSGPVIKLFSRFSDYWPHLNKETYESGLEDSRVMAVLGESREELIQFLENQLTEYVPREDYKELLILALLFLGQRVANVTIRYPGAYHRARWMSKLIYCMKIFLFRSQFKLTKKELAGLREINVFVTKIYLKAWFMCQCAISAPLNDLTLYKELVAYKQINASVANAAIRSFSGHLWYISEHLAGLSLFDPRVASDVKEEIVHSIQNETGNENPPVRIRVSETDIVKMRLPDFVTVQSMQLFHHLGISVAFLKKHPSDWLDDADFNRGTNMLKSLKVVNDAAERAIALITTFNHIITNHEDQKQFLLQIVEKHREKYPNPNKKTVVK